MSRKNISERKRFLWRKNFYFSDESKENLDNRMYIIKIKYFHVVQILRKEFFNFGLDFW